MVGLCPQNQELKIKLKIPSHNSLNLFLNSPHLRKQFDLAILAHVVIAMEELMEDRVAIGVDPAGLEVAPVDGLLVLGA